jgi:hypothetical protein
LQRRVEEVAVGEGSALVELAARVTKLEQGMAELQKQVPAVAETVTNQAAEARASSRAAALAALRTAVDAGRPYATELAAVMRDAPAGADLKPLEAHAGAGVASIEELSLMLESARDAAVDASGGASGAGSDSLMDRMWSSAKSVVRITRSDEGVTGAVDRMKARLAAGDVAGAIAIGSALDEAPRAALAPWLERARARVAANEALARVESSAELNGAASSPREG